MKYCVPYYKNFKYLKEVNEVKISFRTDDLTFIERLVKKEDIINGTAIIDIVDEENFFKNNCLNLFIGLRQKYPDINFKLCFSMAELNDENLYNQLKENDIPFFFRIIPQDLDTLSGLIDLGVSDIYIGSSLGFSLNKIGAATHEKRISIRVFGNIAQSSWGRENSLKSFFIRPEDVIMYEPYVDIIEFIGDEMQLEVLYKVYAIDKEWPDKLKYIISGLNSEVNNKTIVPIAFAKARLGCGKKCVVNFPCSICTRCEEVADTLEKEQLQFKY